MFQGASALPVAQSSSPSKLPPLVPFFIERRWSIVSKHSSDDVLHSFQLALDLSVPPSSQLSSIEYEINTAQFVVWS
jgi:hypothetical protein